MRYRDDRFSGHLACLAKYQLTGFRGQSRKLTTEQGVRPSVRIPYANPNQHTWELALAKYHSRPSNQYRYEHYDPWGGGTGGN